MAKRVNKLQGQGSGLKSRRELAALLAVHPDTVQTWTEMGMPIAERGGRGRATLFDEAAVRAWLDARGEKAKEAVSGNLDPTQERAKKDKWQAQIARHRVLLERRTLLRADEVEREQGAKVAATRAKMLSWPTAWADRLHRTATLEGVPGVERMLRGMVREALLELAGAESETGTPGKPPAKRAKAKGAKTARKPRQRRKTAPEAAA